jgi:hypothetical protein
LRKLSGASAITLLIASFAFAGQPAQARTSREPYEEIQSAPVQQTQPLQGAADWRERMQNIHKGDQSIEQQVRRLTNDLDLTPEQQEKVRQLSKEHNARIQKILDTAPPTLTREAFTAQVHVISQEFHDAVNAILTPHQLELMKAMLGRLSNGQEHRRGT